MTVPSLEPSSTPAPAPGQSLVERHAQLAAGGLAPRPIDGVLRALDLALAGGALVALLPLLGAIAAAIRLTSGSPVLYRGRRVGRAGAIYTMVKFRTLRPDAEERLGPYLGLELTTLTETEVTRIGRFLRRTQLDELPQLFNVVRGEMSLVGPRPIRPTFFEGLCERIPQYWQRLVVRPGMSGLAQMRMTRETSWEEKLAHDLEYIADRSVRLYLSVLGQTLWRVAAREARGGVKLEDRR
jgi:lipopolysaccharide/colanic/teichoic acid biosynthesis glycosyltransferase